MGKTIPISKKQEKIIDLHEQVIKNFSNAKNKEVVFYEGQFQCAAMIQLIITDIKAIIELARKDSIYLPTTILISRRIFDVSTNIAWILKSEDPFEQEARWLRYAHHSKNSDLHFFQTCLKMAQKKKLDVSTLSTQCQGIDDYYNSIEIKFEKMFPKMYDHSTPPPNMKDMLKELGRDEDYLIFITGSHYAHGSIIATQCFTKNFGISKEIGAFISLDDWNICFKTAMMSFLNAGIMYLARTGGNVNRFIPPALKKEIQETIGVNFS